jgi:hypothetical protein
MVTLLGWGQRATSSLPAATAAALRAPGPPRLLPRTGPALRLQGVTRWCLLMQRASCCLRRQQHLPAVTAAAAVVRRDSSRGWQQLRRGCSSRGMRKGMRWMGRTACPPSQARLPTSGCSLWVAQGSRSVHVGFQKCSTHNVGDCSGFCRPLHGIHAFVVEVGFGNQRRRSRVGHGQHLPGMMM